MSELVRHCSSSRVPFDFFLPFVVYSMVKLWCRSRVPFEFFDRSLDIVKVCKGSEKENGNAVLVSEPSRHSGAAAESLSTFVTLHCILCATVAQKKMGMLSHVGTVPTQRCPNRVPFEFFDPSLYIVKICKVGESCRNRSDTVVP